MTFWEAVDRLRRAGAEEVRVHFSGTDDLGGINDVEVRPGRAKAWLEEAELWREVSEALEEETWKLFEENSIYFDGPGSAGYFALNLREGKAELTWWGHDWVTAVEEEEFEAQVDNRLPFSAPEARLSFRVEDGEVLLEGGLPEELLEALAEEVAWALREALRDRAGEDYALAESPTSLLEGEGEVVLKDGMAHVEGWVSGTVPVEVGGDWVESDIEGAWEMSLEDYRRQRALSELAGL